MNPPSDNVLGRTDVEEHRDPASEIMEVLYTRWSPRAMSGESLTATEIGQLFEAARWAPSSYNRQPWRYLYARRDGPHWDRFFDLLVDFNQRWAAEAGLLLVILSKRTDDEGNEAPTHAFDAGASWQNLALQASHLGLVAHGIEGFDYDAARTTLAVPDDYQIHAMAAVGRPGRAEDLPDPMQKKEKPNTRRPARDFTAEGPFSELT